MNTAQELSAERAKRVFDQQLRIVRQRELVAKLEHRDASVAVLGRARTVLAGLELSLGELIAAYERVRKKKRPPTDGVDGCAGRPAKGRRWKSVTVKE